ncbi:MAG: 4'-phosphopantetheinyl transferase [Desulforhopalus sp.]|jgi:4'-phosphopantetheinyl transferase
MLSSLKINHIDVWLLPIAGWDATQLTDAQIHNLLSDKEFLRFQRYRPLSKKAEFVASRLLLRHLLTTYTTCNVAATEAIPDDMGRPFWYENEKPVDLFFSLSHTKDMICCALSHNKEIGCDIESLQPRKYQVELAKRVFSTKEHQFYRDLPGAEQSDFFYRSWTLKEAFIKAMGQGLRIPLTSLSFSYMAHQQDTFTVSPSHLGENWTTSPYSFQSSIPAPGYSLGIATPLTSATISILNAQITGKNLRVISHA